MYLNNPCISSGEDYQFILSFVVIHSFEYHANLNIYDGDSEASYLRHLVVLSYLIIQQYNILSTGHAA